MASRRRTASTSKSKIVQIPHIEEGGCQMCGRLVFRDSLFVIYGNGELVCLECHDKRATSLTLGKNHGESKA